MTSVTLSWDNGTGFDPSRGVTYDELPEPDLNEISFDVPAMADGPRGLRISFAGLAGPIQVVELNLTDPAGRSVWRLDPLDENCRRALEAAAADAAIDSFAPLVEGGRVVFAAAGNEAHWDLPLPDGSATTLQEGARLEIAWRAFTDAAFWHAQARKLGQARHGLVELSLMEAKWAAAQGDVAELARIRKDPYWPLASLLSKIARFSKNPRLIAVRVRQYGGLKIVARLAAKKLGLRRLFRRPPRAPVATPVAGIATPPSDWQMTRYPEYLARRDPELMALDASDCGDQPLISLCVPVYNPEPESFGELIDSIGAQTYPNWQLCLADDCSTDPAVRPRLEALAAKDSRIKILFRPANGHIAEATNSAIELAEGAYIGFIDQDDVLHPAALAQVVRTLERHPDAALLYTDEDKLVAGARTFPFFKPDWSPTLFQAQDFINHLTVIRADLIAAVGGLRPAFNGCQDFDLLFRCIERIRPEQIVHIPEILYHWRVTEGSIAGDPGAKRYAFDAARRCLAEHLERGGQSGQVTEAFHFSLHRVITPRPRDITVSLCLFVEAPDQVDLGPWQSWAAARPDLTLDILLVSTGTQAASRSDVAILPGAEDWSEGARYGATLKALRGDLAILLNGDLGAPDGETLDEWIAEAWRPDVGAVGPRVLDKDDRVVHGGVILAPDGLRLPYFGHDKRDHGRFQHLQLPHEVAAVAPYAMALKRSLLEDVPEMASATGVALAVQIAARRQGQQSLWTPHVSLLCPDEPLRSLFGDGLPGRDLDRLRPDMHDPTYNPKLRSTACSTSRSRLGWAGPMANPGDCVIVLAPTSRREFDATAVATALAFRAKCQAEGIAARLVLLDPDRRLPAGLLRGVDRPTRIGAQPGQLPADPEIGTPYLWLTRASRLLDLWLRQARPTRVVAVDVTGALFYPALAKRHGLAHHETALECLRLGPLEQLLANHFLLPSSADLAAAHMAWVATESADRTWAPKLEAVSEVRPAAPSGQALDLVALLGSNDPIAAGWSARVAKALADHHPDHRPRLVLARLGRKANTAQWQEASKLLADSGVTLASEALRPATPNPRSVRAFCLMPWDGADCAVLAAQPDLPLGIKATAARYAGATPWALPPAPLEAAAAIAERLENEPPPARLIFEPSKPAPATASVRDGLPSVTVGLLHFNRPILLLNAIESLERQSYQGPLDVIIVDDGSPSEEARTTLERLEAELPAERWRILRKSNGYPGAARNAVAAEARGNFLLFMDDDNLAKPRMVETLVQAAQAGGADIVTCLNDAFNRLEGDGRPVSYGERLFLGNALALGPLANVFGDVNALIRRTTFERLGGFTEDYAVGCEDWEFFLRAALAGADLQVIPESLFHYRVAPGSITDTTSMARNVSRVARALLARHPDGLSALAAFTQRELLALPPPDDE